jgi:hypothetical protein
MELFWPVVHVGSLLVLFDAALFNLYDGPQPGDARAQAWLAWSAILTGYCWIIVSLADMTDGIGSTPSTVIRIEPSVGYLQPK